MPSWALAKNGPLDHQLLLTATTHKLEAWSAGSLVSDFQFMLGDRQALLIWLGSEF